MGVMSMPETRSEHKRTITVRLSDFQIQTVEAAARRLGITRSEYIRYAVFERARMDAGQVLGPHMVPGVVDCSPDAEDAREPEPMTNPDSSGKASFVQGTLNKIRGSRP